MGQFSDLPLTPCRKLAKRPKSVLEHERIVLRADELGSVCTTLLTTDSAVEDARRCTLETYVPLGLTVHGM